MPSKRISPAKRDKFIHDQIAFWRNTLRIDPHLELKVKYATNPDPVDRDYASIDREMMEYGKATMEIYDEVFASNQFEKEAESAVCHEVLHLALHPLVAYCNNMFYGDEGKQKELQRLEEEIVKVLEPALTGLKPKR